MLRLSDKGKHELRIICSFRIIFSFILSLIIGGVVGLAGTGSSISIKESVSFAFSNAARQTDNNKITIISCSSEIKQREEYLDLYFKSLSIWSGFIDKSSFSFFPGFFANAPSDYHYSSNELFGTDKPISLLPSATNTIYENNGLYIHEVWNLNMMFDANVIAGNDDVKYSNFCYIPESSAKRILINKGIQDPTMDDYRSLLGNPVSIDYFDENGHQSLSWIAANIFYEDSNYDFYKDVIGFFIPCYYLNLPSFSSPSVAIGFGRSMFLCDEQIKNLLNLKNNFGDQNYFLSDSDHSLVNNFNYLSLLDAYEHQGFKPLTIILASLFMVVLLSAFNCLFLKRYKSKYILFAALFSVFIACLISWLFALLLPSFYSFSSALLIFVSVFSNLIPYVVFKFILISPRIKGLALYDAYKI